MLTIENLNKNFGGLQAVRNCSFEIKEGTITGLIGPNGAGKTTTFSMIAGELAPTSGRIVFEGKDIAGLPTHEMFHRGIVRTFQIPHEFAKMTVLENLMVVPPEQPGERLFANWISRGQVKRREREVRDRAEDALEFLSISHLGDEQAGNLSGGQKKLLELGRTMMTDAKLVLLDEPGAGVNPTLLLKIREMISRLREERDYTFCVIEHDMDLIASLCDPVIVLAEGTVLMQGHMTEVRSNPDVLDAYLGGGEEN
ncbi:ABC transporter ATP-binding protein [Denitrobaculum tricleocarpae]|uniref:ABC transporter ATP-binding protein n=1 Tax=Denitrobaculum tricleocarpae TaxID=2591009 RepID=A0A545STP0_9PROT|nr:ABC transporter ATP-binding protein [Denitrobaculum tricleocarpae]TQV68327.1 ABC transporter ATP-binding protein [Denitrobaculum tricleocarpae]